MASLSAGAVIKGSAPSSRLNDNQYNLYTICRWMTPYIHSKSAENRFWPEFASMRESLISSGKASGGVMESGWSCAKPWTLSGAKAMKAKTMVLAGKQMRPTTREVIFPLLLRIHWPSFSLKVSFWLDTWRCQQGVRFTGLQGRETQSSPLSDLQNINLCSCWTPILVTLNNSPPSLVSSRLLKRQFWTTSRLVWYVWPGDIYCHSSPGPRCFAEP